MILSTVILTVTLFLGQHTSAYRTRPRNVTVSHTSGGDEYIVILSKNPDTAREIHAASVLSQIDLSPSHPDVRLLFNNSAFHGFAASMQSHCIDQLQNMTDVEHVEKSVAVSAHLYMPAKRDTNTTRTGTTWGLQRISSTSAVTGDSEDLDYTYTTSASDVPLGAGVDIYVVDSGINVQHEVFSGRARMGWSFETDASDGDGHGTHVSGTAAGAIFGVASSANLIGVKVLGSDGSGSTADTIAGMDYVIQQHDRRKAEGGDSGFVGSIMSMSWALSGTSSAIGSAVAAAAEAGVHVSLAAGNAGKDACNYSPSNSGGSGSNAVVTVGSVNIGNTISSFSNTGSCVDIYAPGEDILSAWKDTPLTVNYLSGTSMSCPHVSGVMAYLMAQDPQGLGQNPVGLKSKLLGMALRGAITSDSNALLLNNGAAPPSSKTKRNGGCHEERMNHKEEPSTRVKMLMEFFSR